LLHANLIFMGPGSPTYAIRQLQGSLAWDIIRARHRLGATLVFSSAATIAVGAFGLPVYEIYKVGQDVHIVPGLNFFADYDTSISIVPHWNNTDGGADMDTSRCFIGMDRFSEWCAQLPSGQTVLGLDEHTGIILNFVNQQCQVVGVSSVSLVRECNPQIYPSGTSFPLSQLGPFLEPASIADGIPDDVWQLVSNTSTPAAQPSQLPPEQVVTLAEARQSARARKDWAASDELRRQIADLGWAIKDVEQGWKLVKN
jgi:hypothetical protein